MKLHPDVVAIKRKAPKWAKWLGVSPNGNFYWNTGSDPRCAWMTGNADDDDFHLFTSRTRLEVSDFGICLSTGDVRIPQCGEIVRVPQSKWVAARKRKAKP